MMSFCVIDTLVILGFGSNNTKIVETQLTMSEFIRVSDCYCMSKCINIVLRKYDDFKK